MSFKYERVEDEIYSKFRKSWSSTSNTELVKVTPNELNSNFPIKINGNIFCTFPLQYESIAEKIRTFEVREDDVWIIGYPRSGSTWTQEWIWLLKNHLDFENAKKVDQLYRIPLLELNCLRETMDIMEYLQKLPSPRCIKTHLPIQLLPEQVWTKHPKMIHIKRNFKDVAISYFHFYKLVRNYSGSMEQFMEAFMADFIEYSPYYPHVKNYCDAGKVLKNILFLNYEDLKMDLKSAIQLTANFLGLSPLSEENLQKLCDFVSIESMKKNPSINREAVANSSNYNKNNKQDENLNFVRRGKVEGWKDEISDELSSQLDKWIDMEKNKY